LVAEQGIRVSGEWKDGKLFRDVYKKNGDILLDINDKADVVIKQKNGNLSLSVME
jgi:hypothetical protein